MDLISFVISRGGIGTIRCPVLSDLANTAGCSVGTLYQVALAHKKPSAKLATRIQAATNGVVSRRDLRPDDWHLIWPELAETSLDNKEDLPDAQPLS